MNARSFKSIVTFSNPFSLTAHSKELSAGEYELLVEEDVHPGRSSEGHRGTRAYLTARSLGNHTDQTETHSLSEEDLKMALGHVWDISDNQYNNRNSEAADYPQEEIKWKLPNG